MKVELLRTTLVGSLIGLTKLPKSSLIISKSPSLTMQVSNLYGLSENLLILIYIGNYSDSSSFYPSTGGHAYVLHCLVRTGSPLHG